MRKKEINLLNEKKSTIWKTVEVFIRTIYECDRKGIIILEMKKKHNKILLRG